MVMYVAYSGVACDKKLHFYQTIINGICWDAAAAWERSVRALPVICRSMVCGCNGWVRTASKDWWPPVDQPWMRSGTRSTPGQHRLIDRPHFSSIDRSRWCRGFEHARDFLSPISNPKPPQERDGHGVVVVVVAAAAAGAGGGEELSSARRRRDDGWIVGYLPSALRVRGSWWPTTDEEGKKRPPSTMDPKKESVGSSDVFVLSCTLFISSFCD